MSDHRYCKHNCGGTDCDSPEIYITENEPTEDSHSGAWIEEPDTGTTADISFVSIPWPVRLRILMARFRRLCLQKDLSK